MERWLTKTEVNAHYYNTVAGEIGFGTEAQAGLHAKAAARLIALQAGVLGKRRIRILEIAANNCAFARALLEELRQVIAEDYAELERIDYVAVEYARPSLEGAATWEEQHGAHDRVLRPRGVRVTHGLGLPDRPTLVALAVDTRPLEVNLALVHAEANQFVAATEERFDFAILNELLDDMPYRVYYADAEGRRREAAAASRAEENGWTVRISAHEVADGDELAGMPPASLTARSPESVELVTGIAGLLEGGGMLLLHDYGFAGLFAALAEYEGLPPSVPAFVTMDFPAAGEQGFPRSFYRVFGNDRLGVVQVTNDVNFAEIAAALEGAGAVTTLAHGNAIVNAPGGKLARGDGVFLSEFGLLEQGDDLPALLAGLHARQGELRERYVREQMEGRGSVFLDLVFVKA